MHAESHMSYTFYYNDIRGKGRLLGYVWRIFWKTLWLESTWKQTHFRKKYKKQQWVLYEYIHYSGTSRHIFLCSDPTYIVMHRKHGFVQLCIWNRKKILKAIQYKHSNSFKSIFIFSTNSREGYTVLGPSIPLPSIHPREMNIFVYKWYGQGC